MDQRVTASPHPQPEAACNLTSSDNTQLIDCLTHPGTAADKGGDRRCTHALQPRNSDLVVVVVVVVVVMVLGCQ